jgi:hypothetical protein
MKKIFYGLIFLISQMGFSQNNLLWQGYFSYNEIKDVSVSTTTILLPQKTLCFLKNTTDNQIKTTNTIGFQARQSAPLLQCRFDKTLVGYENGLIVVINEADGAMLKVVDIINKQLPANRKK